MDRRASLFDFPERLVSWQKFLPYVVLLSVTLALYGSTLYFQFVWDDGEYLHKNLRIQGLSLFHLRLIWTSSFLGHYAPLHNTFLAILHQFSGLEPFGYHVGQLLLHAACVCLLFLVLKKIESPRVALLATLLFAVHPTNIETAAWIAETKSTLAFFFFLLSFWFFIRLRERTRWKDGILCGLFLILSLLAKINTVVAPAVFLVYDSQQAYPLRKEKVWSLACYFLIGALFTVIHLSSFHGSPTSLESSYYGGLAVHLLNIPFLLAFYLRMVVFPHPLSGWHLVSIYPELNWISGGAWIGLLAILGLLSRSPRAVQFWGLWFFVFLLPILQIIPFPMWVAERYLYIPAIGAFVLGSRLFFRLSDRLVRPWQRLAAEFAMIGLVLVFAGQTRAHLPVWENDLTFWEATTATCLSSAYCHSSLGMALLRNGQTERGVKELIRAVEIRPEPRYLQNLGDAYTLHLGDHRQAIRAYQMALERAQGLEKADFYARLARTYTLAGNFAEANRALQIGKSNSHPETSFLMVEALLRWKEGNVEETRRLLRRAFALAEEIPDPSGFILSYWGDPAAVVELPVDLRSGPTGNR